jgi:hypothetical protein
MTEQNNALVRAQPSAVQNYTMGQLLEMGAAIVKSGLVPRAVKTAEAAAVIMLTGQELGLRPMQSFAHLYVVNGQAAMDTKLVGALFARRGGAWRVTETTAERCTIRFTDRKGETTDLTLTMAEAKEARWDQNYDGEKKAWEMKPTWKSMPAVMLRWACLRTGIRMIDPGCLFGRLTVDEAQSMATDGDSIVEAEVRQLTIETDPQGEEGQAQVDVAPQKSRIEWWKDAPERASFAAWRDEHGLTDAECKRLASVYQGLGAPVKLFMELGFDSREDLQNAIEAQIARESALRGA